MAELIHTIRTLSIMLIGFAVLFGLISPMQAFKRIARIFVMPIALLLAWTFIVEAWSALPPVARVGAIAVGVPVSVAVLLASTGFGREVLASVAGNALYDGSRKGCACAGRLLLLLVLAALAAALLWVWRGSV